MRENNCHSFFSCVGTYTEVRGCFGAVRLNPARQMSSLKIAHKSNLQIQYIINKSNYKFTRTFTPNPPPANIINISPLLTRGKNKRRMRCDDEVILFVYTERAKTQD